MSSQAISTGIESRRKLKEEGDCSRKATHPVSAPATPKKASTSHCEKEEVNGLKPSTFSTRRLFKLLSATWCSVKELASRIKARSKNPSGKLLSEQPIFCAKRSAKNTEDDTKAMAAALSLQKSLMP